MGKDLRFKVVLPAKPYVRQYLINHYRDERYPNSEAVSLKGDPELKGILRNILYKKSHRNRNKYPKVPLHYNMQVEIVISHDEFDRYGWEIAPEDAVRFGRIIEQRAKNEMLLFLDTYTAFGQSISLSIDRFQKLLHYPEDIWSAETIRREYTRKRCSKSDLRAILIEHIDHIIMAKMPRFGTTLETT